MKIGPKYKICRRLGSRVFGKCQTTKFTTSGSPQRGGKKAGGGRPRNVSEYGTQLLEKQKARYSYGLKESQFSNYVKEVHQHKAANPMAALYQALETRLDNIVHRLGLASTRRFARQLVSHGHITVNGRRVNIPSYRAKVGDKIAVRAQSRSSAVFSNMEEKLKGHHLPAWLIFDQEKLEGTVKAMPLFGESEADINFGAILEFYSRV